VNLATCPSCGKRVALISAIAFNSKLSTWECVGFMYEFHKHSDGIQCFHSTKRAEATLADCHEKLDQILKLLEE